jgi:hypothetical protein
MDCRFISIHPIAKSMIDTKYEQEHLKIFYFLCRWELVGQYGTETVYLYLTCLLLDFCTH